MEELLSPAAGNQEERESLIRKVLASGLTIRSQQRGDPELTESQKMETVHHLLHHSPAVFLKRYGHLLSGSDLSYFDGVSSGRYEVQFRLQELRRNLDPRVKQRRVRNRRFECMKEMMENTDYFSEEEMRSRNPLLFEHCIGQYLSEDERVAMDGRGADMSLSGHIMRKMELDRRRELLRLQRSHEAEQTEETDTSSEDEDEEEEVEEEEEEEVQEKEGMEGGRNKYGHGLTLSSDPEAASQERAMLRTEFLKAMQQSFLNGEDKDFDYTMVDQSDRYDPVEIRQRDDEESYFDAEEPAWCEGEAEDIGDTNNVAMDTGDCSDTDDYMSDKYLQPKRNN